MRYNNPSSLLFVDIFYSFDISFLITKRQYLVDLVLPNRTRYQPLEEDERIRGLSKHWLEKKDRYYRCCYRRKVTWRIAWKGQPPLARRPILRDLYDLAPLYYVATIYIYHYNIIDSILSIVRVLYNFKSSLNNAIYKHYAMATIVNGSRSIGTTRSTNKRYYRYREEQKRGKLRRKRIAQ